MNLLLLINNTIIRADIEVQWRRAGNTTLLAINTLILTWGFLAISIVHEEFLLVFNSLSHSSIECCITALVISDFIARSNIYGNYLFTKL